jgi:hypothetical protein
MSKIRLVVTVCLATASAAGIGFIGCSKKGEPAKEQTVITQDKPGQEKPAENQNNAICIFDGLALKQEPSKAGKWLASMSLGETAKWLGDSAMDQGDKNRCYQKIQLSDGKIGWATSYGLVINGKLGAVKEDAAICKRPDLLTGTDEKMESMKPVAIIQEKGEWAEFVSDGRKKSGWIRTSSITSDPIDVAVAVLALKKITPKEAKDHAASVKAFVEASPYPESFFIKKLKATLDAAQPAVAAPTDTTAAKAAGTPAPATQMTPDTGAKK